MRPLELKIVQTTAAVTSLIHYSLLPLTMLVNYYNDNYMTGRKAKGGVIMVGFESRTKSSLNISI